MDNDRPAAVFEEQSTPGRQGISLRTGFFVLDWTVKFSPVTVAVDEQLREVPWGQHFFPLPAGRHELHVSYRHVPFRQAGRASIHVDVPAGEVVRVSYDAPRSVLVGFLPGKLTVIR